MSSVLNWAFCLFKAFLREEGGAQLRDGRSLRYFEVFTLYKLTRHFYKHFAFVARAPSVSLHTSLRSVASLLRKHCGCQLPPGGSLSQNTSYLYHSFAFFSSADLF